MAQIKASEVIREAQRLIDTHEKAKLGGRVDQHKYFYVKISTTSNLKRHGKNWSRFW